MIKLEKMNIIERTNYMYKLLNSLDKINKTIFNHGLIFLWASFLINFLDDVINWFSWEIKLVRKNKRINNFELTRDIDYFLVSGKVEDIYYLLEDKNYKDTSEYKLIRSKLDKLNKLNNKLCDIYNSLDLYEEIIISSSENSGNDFDSS